MSIHELLVTGGAGFVGSNFVRYVVGREPDVHVVVLDKLTYAGNLASLADLPPERVEFVRGDVCDAVLLDRLVGRADAVAHFAAESHNDNSIADPLPFVRTNVEGTARVLEACRAHDVRLHHVSTDEVFGDLALGDDARFTEDSPMRPSSPYASSKAAADLMVRAWARTYGVRATISNCCNNYGPRQHVEKLVPRQIVRIMSGRRPALYGDGSNVRDWLHVEDHCSAVWEILAHGRVGETYLVGGSCERSNKQVVGTLLELMGCPSDWVRHVADRPGHDVRYALDWSKLRDGLGWRPTHADFEAGLERTVAWYQANRAWWEPTLATLPRGL